MTASRSLAGLLALVTLAPAACNSTPEEPPPTWARADVVAGSDSLLWKVVLLSLRKMDFPEGADLDRSRMRVASGWKIELAPWKGRGTRKQANVTCVPIGPGRWGLQVRVKTQVNNTLTRPLDYTYAEWEWVADDVESARILLQHIRTFLSPEIELEERPTDPVDEYLKKIGEG
jgi:hypothetical protein